MFSVLLIPTRRHRSIKVYLRIRVNAPECLKFSRIPSVSVICTLVIPCVLPLKISVDCTVDADCDGIEACVGEGADAHCQGNVTMFILSNYSCKVCYSHGTITIDSGPEVGAFDSPNRPQKFNFVSQTRYRNAVVSSFCTGMMSFCPIIHVKSETHDTTRVDIAPEFCAFLWSQLLCFGSVLV